MTTPEARKKAILANVRWTLKAKEDNPDISIQEISEMLEIHPGTARKLYDVAEALTFVVGGQDTHEWNELVLNIWNI